MKVDLDEIERLLLKIRASKSSDSVLKADGPCRGALVLFPVVVPAPSDGRPWSLRFSAEPGFMKEGVHRINWSGRIEDWELDGEFYVGVGVALSEVPEQAMRSQWCGEGPAPDVDWVGVCPTSGAVPAREAPLVAMRIRRLRKEAAMARAELLRIAMPLVDQLACEGRAGVRRRRQWMEHRDLLQEGGRSVVTVIEQFASDRRPSVGWASALGVALRRDLQRAVLRLDWAPETVARVRVWLESNPDVTDIDEAIARMAEHKSRPRVRKDQEAERQVGDGATAALGGTRVQRSDVVKAWKMGRLCAFDEATEGHLGYEDDAFDAVVSRLDADRETEALAKTISTIACALVGPPDPERGAVGIRENAAQVGEAVKALRQVAGLENGQPNASVIAKLRLAVEARAAAATDEPDSLEARRRLRAKVAPDGVLAGKDQLLAALGGA